MFCICLIHVICPILCYLVYICNSVSLIKETNELRLYKLMDFVVR